MNAFKLKNFDTSPMEAVAALMTHEVPVYVDLDETLCLRNFSGYYIDPAGPGVVAIALLQPLELMRPQKCTEGDPPP
jgi:hypothetical protein